MVCRIAYRVSGLQRWIIPSSCESCLKASKASESVCVTYLVAPCSYSRVSGPRWIVQPCRDALRCIYLTLCILQNVGHIPCNTPSLPATRGAACSWDMPCPPASTPYRSTSRSLRKEWKMPIELLLRRPSNYRLRSLPSCLRTCRRASLPMMPGIANLVGYGCGTNYGPRR